MIYGGEYYGKTYLGCKFLPFFRVEGTVDDFANYFTLHVQQFELKFFIQKTFIHLHYYSSQKKNQHLF